jgi:RNA 3'-terminal phosphate cyclase (ATP)
MMELVDIDGAAGEGGGQVVRTSLALAMATGTPVRITRIRARRARGGLLRQHLTAVHAVAEACGATVRGAELGSTTLELEPGTARHGEYRFAVGTAGSAALVLQTLLTGLLRREGESRIVVEGGTDNPAAPPSDFLVHVWAPLVRALGADLHVEIERRGFYPAGGGRVVATLCCPAHLRGFERMERGETLDRRAIARVSALPLNIAHRELHRMKVELGLGRDELRAEEVKSPRGPGNTASLIWRCDDATEVFTGFGAKGKSAEDVARELVSEAQRWDAARVPVGEHQADQLVLLLALAGEGASGRSRRACTRARSSSSSRAFCRSRSSSRTKAMIERSFAFAISRPENSEANSYQLS